MNSILRSGTSKRTLLTVAAFVFFNPIAICGESARAQELATSGSEAEPATPQVPITTSARESVDAIQLLKRARFGVAFAAKALRDSKSDPRSKTLRPFASALKRSYGDLRSVDKAIASRSAAPFFASLRKSSRDLAELSAVANAAGLTSSGYRQGIRLGRESVQFLRAGYGKEALRRRRDSVPSPAESSRFSAIKNEIANFETALGKLRATAAAKSDLATTRVIDAFASRSNSIGNAPATVAGFADVIIYLSVLEGGWKGASYYINPSSVAGWKDADAALQRALELLKDSSNWIEAVDWNDLSAQIQIPSAAGPRMEMTDIELLEIEKFIDSLEAAEAGEAISSAYDRSLSGLSGDADFERLSDVTNRSGVADSTLVSPPPSGARDSSPTSDEGGDEETSSADPISAPPPSRPYDGPTSKDRPSGAGQPSTWADPTGGSNGRRGSGDSGDTGSDSGGSSGGGMGGGGSSGGGNGGGGGSGDDAGVGDDGNEDRTDGRISG